jgi:hypothetical protein
MTSEVERMTKDEVIAVLKEIQKSPKYNAEMAHVRADEALCKFLRSLGYDDVVNEWEAASPKWYA